MLIVLAGRTSYRHNIATSQIFVIDSTNLSQYTLRVDIDKNIPLDK